MTSRWLLWSPIIKELYLIHYSPLKNMRCTQKVQFKDRNWRHPDADFVIWVAGSHLGFTQNGVLRCCKIWTPWFYHSFVPIDISTITEFWDSNLANPISVTCQPPPVTAHIQCHVQYIPRNMHTVFALLCFVVVIHWLIFPYPAGLLHWHCGNLTIAPVPAKQPWWIWINTTCEFIMNDCITTTKQSTTKPCAYFLGYTVDGQNQGTGLFVIKQMANIPIY